MAPATLHQRPATARDVLLFASPGWWPSYPVLPVIREVPGLDEPQFGILYDACTMSGIYGYSSTVFLLDPARLPTSEAQLLDGPKLVYDSPEELAADGWVVDVYE